MFKLEGSVVGAKDSDNIILYYYTLKNNEWQEIADTTKIINGRFFFEGKIDELTAATLCFDKSYVAFDARIYLEPTTMKLEINKNQLYAYKLSGTKVEEENIELRKAIEPEEKMFDTYLKYQDEMIGQINLNYDNIPVRDSLIDILTQSRAKFKVDYKIDKVLFEFIKKHNNYRIVPDILYQLRNSDSIPIDTLKSIYNNLPERLRNSLMGRFAYEQIEEQEQLLNNKRDTSIGSDSPDFTKEDYSGKIIRLSEYRNKNFVLLDFWATWCRPCVDAIPAIKNLYGKYSKKGLTFISISADTDSIKWANAVKKYQIDTWNQILDVVNSGKESIPNSHKDNLYTIYNVVLIPQFFLIDKQGKIIAKCNDIDELKTAIDKVLK